MNIFLPDVKNVNYTSWRNLEKLLDDTWLKILKSFYKNFKIFSPLLDIPKFKI